MAILLLLFHGNGPDGGAFERVVARATPRLGFGISTAYDAREAPPKAYMPGPTAKNENTTSREGVSAGLLHINRSLMIHRMPT